MKILQRYLLRELFGPLCLGIIVFTFVFMIQQIFRFVDLLLNSGVPWWIASEMVASMLPAAMTLSIPMAVLVAILMGMGRLSAEREVLAIRMSGVNLISVVWPIWLFAAVLSGIMICGNFTLVPYLTLKTSDLATQIQFIIIDNIPANRIYEIPESGGRNTSIVFESRNENRDMMSFNLRTTVAPDNIDELRDEADELKTSISIEQKKDAPDSMRLEAYTARLKKINEESGKMRDVFITAHCGKLHQDIAQRLVEVELMNGEVSIGDANDTSSLTLIRFDRLTKGFIPRFDRMRTGVWRKRPIEMTVPELIDKHSTETPETYGDYDEIWPELWSRFSLPLACLAFALIAIPLGIFMRPTGKVIPFAVSFLLILIYYGMLQFGRTLAKDGSLFGAFMVFLPNIVLMLTGWCLTWRMTRK
ncbi:MAG: LptF/LptG family permease [Candidatus ainarchaeum sp.]|nr:LptF/LptG family permease [Candidatus ainarchaeum sp.]